MKLNKLSTRLDEYHRMLSDDPTMVSLEERLLVCFKGIINDLRVARVALEQFNLIEAKVIKGKSPDLSSTVGDIFNNVSIFKALLKKINATTNGYRYENYIEFQEAALEIKHQFSFMLNVYDETNQAKASAVALRTAINNISTVINEMIDEYNNGVPTDQAQRKIGIRLEGR